MRESSHYTGRKKEVDKEETEVLQYDDEDHDKEGEEQTKDEEAKLFIGAVRLYRGCECYFVCWSP